MSLLDNEIIKYSQASAMAAQLNEENKLLRKELDIVKKELCDIRAKYSALNDNLARECGINAAFKKELYDYINELRKTYPIAIKLPDLIGMPAPEGDARYLPLIGKPALFHLILELSKRYGLVEKFFDEICEQLKNEVPEEIAENHTEETEKEQTTENDVNDKLNKWKSIFGDKI